MSDTIKQAECPSGIADPDSEQITFGLPEPDLARQSVRHRRFYTWTEDGVLCGSWTWQPGHPPIIEERT
jgi:hypothetical protein